MPFRDGVGLRFKEDTIKNCLEAKFGGFWVSGGFGNC